MRLYPLYNSNDVQLWAIQPSFAALGSNTNQAAVGGWLDGAYQDQALEAFRTALRLGPESADTRRNLEEAIRAATAE